MSTLIALEEANFQNGEPVNFEFDEIYKCFNNSSNGLLFRLVNKTTGQWAFYNDTADTVMKVRALLGPGSTAKALRRAHLTVIPKEDGTVDDSCEQEITVEVDPFRTELFLEGKVNGFSMDFASEAAPVREPNFEYRQPTVPYNKVYKCFKNNGNGLLFRLVDDKKNTWAFYNDTREFLMVATVEFENAEGVSPLGKTQDMGVPENYPDGVTYRLEIEPGKTEAFIEGDAQNYHLSFSAEPLSNDRPLDPSEVNYENGEPNADVIDASAAKVYKCFKNNGNGLLFRLVDEENGVWAFYNDTVEYIMQAKARFPESEQGKFSPSEHAEVSEDPEHPGDILVTVEVAPTETVLFLTGAPTNFEISAAAESVSKAKPETNPEYENGQPDEEIAPHNQVFKVFKDRGNGLLFRLVDTESGNWGFYNDTVDTTFKVSISFDEDTVVKPLGNTQVGEDPDQEGPAYVAEVPPGATIPFVQGDIHAFSSKVSARRRSVPGQQPQQ